MDGVHSMHVVQKRVGGAVAIGNILGKYYIHRLLYGMNTTIPW